MEAFMEDDDLDSYVEAVTTYRCKFCAFTATDTKAVGQHVRASHIPLKKKLPDGTSTAGSLASNDLPLESMQNEVNHYTVKALNETNNPTSQVPCTGQILSLLNTRNKDSVSIKSDTEESADVSPTKTSIASGTAALMDSSEILPSADHYSTAVENEHNANYQLIAESDTSQMIVENCGNVDVSANRFVHVLVTNQQDLQNSDASLTLDSSTQSDACKYIEENSMHDFASSRSQHVTNVKHQVANEVDPLTKELYLCGTCSEGFTSINDCKLHMTNVHGVTEFQMGNLPRKVDTGTQMEHKKRGRKKKSECVPKVEPPDADENADNESVDGPLSGSDEDWIESLQTYSTRSRRKRRPPPALKSDYYLGRTKKKEKKEETLSDVKPSLTGYRCDERNCGTKFTDEALLEKHKEYHVKDSTPGANHFKCTSCDQTFAAWKAVKIHAWKSHSEDLGLFKCHYCSFRTDASSKLRIHMEIHGTDRPYVCGKCDKGFKQFAQLKNHEQTHMEREKVQQNMDDSRRTCDVCSRVFASQKCMRIHREAVHSGHKPFKCGFCEHTCARKAMLILHQRIHTGEKPFKCNVCHYSCSDHNSLRRHRMRHTGLKPYKCPHCPYACIQAISLKVHIKNKHPDLGGIFCCNLCQYRTVNGQQFQNHLLDHKNGLLPIDADYVGAIEPPLSHSGLTLQTRRSRASYARQGVKTSFPSTRAPGQENIIGFVQHTDTVSGGQHLLQIPVSAASGEEHLAQLQIQLNENSEALISAEEYEKIAGYEGSESQSEINATNLIYSALSAISMQSNNQMDLGMEPHDLVSKIQNGDIQTSIETNFNKDGVTTHTITFRLPDGGELLGGVTLQESSEEKEVVDVLEADTAGGEWQIVNDQTSMEYIEAGS